MQTTAINLVPAGIGDRPASLRLALATVLVAGIGVLAAYGCCLGGMSAGEMAVMSMPICNGHGVT